MSKTDLYGTLGIDKTASLDEIKKAYKKLALQWHPDKNQHQKELASDKFKSISEAYQILSNPKTRQQYDQFGLEGCSDEGGNFRPCPGRPFDGIRIHVSSRNDGSFLFGSPESIFEQFFANHAHMFNDSETFFRRRPGNCNNLPNRPSETHYKLAVDLETLYKGGNKKLKVTIPETGHSEILEVTVLPGYKSGTRITMNSSKHRIVVTLSEKPHHRFTRRDNDLYCSVKKADKPKFVATLDNRKLPLSSRSDEDRVIFRGEGMPIRQGGAEIGKGDLIVELV